jgi:hypothetical protein
MSDYEEYLPDNVKELREYFDTIVKSIYTLPYEEKMRACESLHKAFSGKFSIVSAGVGMEFDDFTITIRPNKENLDTYSHLIKQKEYIESELLKIDNPSKYAMEKDAKTNDTYPWKAGYVCKLDESTGKPLIVSNVCRWNVFDDWYRTVSGGVHQLKTDMNRFSTVDAAEIWLEEQTKL